MSNDLKRKWVKFNDLEVNSKFTLPNNVFGVEEPFVKISENTYASMLTRLVYFAYSDNMQVDVSIIEKSNEYEESN